MNWLERLSRTRQDAMRLHGAQVVPSVVGCDGGALAPFLLALLFGPFLVPFWSSTALVVFFACVTLLLRLLRETAALHIPSIQPSPSVSRDRVSLLAICEVTCRTWGHVLVSRTYCILTAGLGCWPPE
jgi:hypothetical protein